MSSDKRHPNAQSAAERIAAKQRSRDDDARRLASGEISPDELRRENSHFREFAHNPISWDKTRLI